MRWFILFCLLLSGCAVGKVTICTELDDGSSECCSAEYSHFLRNYSETDFNVCNAARASVAKSSVDAKVVESIATGVVKAIIKDISQ